ncbi:MAG: Glu/Leu/Phe/Val dehydrogenase dimerization domain-containing protein [Alphaproteobacteria bacterium]
MAVFCSPDFDNHEHISFFSCKETGLQVIIAIHSTYRGPTLGGCRMWPYETEQEAIMDALRLSRGMTYKAAMADLPYGGGKAVIIGDPQKEKSEALFRSLGRCLNHLNGRYITGEDVGTSVEDMEIIRATSPYVVGLSTKTPGGSGDPSPVTAYGVYKGMLAAIKYKMGKDSVKGLRVGVQGLGHVGANLCKILHENGAKLMVADISQTRMQEMVDQYGAEAVAPEIIYCAELDIFAPCALGGILNEHTIPLLRAPIVAGAANNQLAAPRDGEYLNQRDILYAPDYVINSGGLINVTMEGAQYNRERAYMKVDQIYDTLMQVFTCAEKKEWSTSHAADYVAEQRLSNSSFDLKLCE